MNNTQQKTEETQQQVVLPGALSRKVKFCSDEDGDQQVWVWMTAPEPWTD